MGFQNLVLEGGGHIFIEVHIYIGRLTMPMGSGDQGDRDLGANFLFWSYLSWLVIYRVPKSGDAHFYLHLRPGAYGDFEENEGISHLLEHVLIDSWDNCFDMLRPGFPRANN